MRTHLTEDFANLLDGRVTSAVDRAVGRLIERLAEYLWIHYQDASRVLVVTDDVTDLTTPVAIHDAFGTVLWAIDGPGWEPGGDNGPLHSLAPEDAADRHGAIIHSDIASIGSLLPLGSRHSTEGMRPCGIRSSARDADWEILLPLTSDRLQFLSEEALDRKARRS